MWLSDHWSLVIASLVISARLGADMSMSALFLAGREWLWPSIATLGLALVFVAWSYTRADAPRGIRLMCAALKILGLAALAACLLEPMWTGERARPGANIIAVIADNSQSMTLHGPDEKESRAAVLARMLTDEKNNHWRSVLGENFEVRNYLADSHLQGTQNFAELTFDGRTSALGNALTLLAERHNGQPLAGVLLLTDGVAADLADTSKLSGLPPIHPVVFGNDRAANDIAITSTSTTQTSFEDAPVSVQAEVNATGFRGRDVVAKLTAVEAGKSGMLEKTAGEQTLRVPDNSDRIAFRFQLRPEKSGVFFYRLRVTSGESALEATTANNETIVAVDRGHGPHRVLYVSGRPNWEYKFLSRAVESDDQIQLAGLIRVAKREPKFEFRGRDGESSNPLFRGFGNQSKEDVEQYDKPVLVRLNTEDEFELKGGFPKTPEELFKYEAVIIDDLEAAFFTADQMSLMQRFVSERGGSLLMLGGTESFHDGAFQRTAIGDMLPVYLDRIHASLPGAGLRLSLTREGWLQPWARLRAKEPEEEARLAALPAFDVLNHVGDPKPAATVVATVTDGQHQLPALLTQRFGRGRAASLLIGDFWQSGLGDEGRMNDLERAWRQMTRWLVADVGARVEVRLDPKPEAQAMLIQVRARDAAFQPLDNATVNIKVQTIGRAGESATIALPAEASAGEAGLYEATYVPRESGGYRVEASVTDQSGAVAGSAQAGWSTDLAAAEFRSLTPNRALMESLATKTGGQVLTPDQLDAFVRELPSRRVPVTETWTRPIWHTPAMFLFALACFVAEWGIRRKKGLA